MADPVVIVAVKVRHEVVLLPELGKVGYEKVLRTHICFIYLDLDIGVFGLLSFL